VVVDNRGGANGIIGQDAAANANPDGYTMLARPLRSQSTPASTSSPTTAIKDFLPMTLFAATPLMLVVNPAVPA
jgi:tripartite-type tricarboxylate transporter receptor subunit TctC